MKLFYRELQSSIFQSSIGNLQSDNHNPIIILHGLFGMSDNWMTVGKKFAENHQVYLPDLRNHGRSPHSEEFNYQVMVDDLVEFIDNLQILPGYSRESQIPILIGHSLGGKIVMHFAMKYPEKLRKLVVVDIAPKYYPIQHDSILTGLLSLKLAGMKSRKDIDIQLAQYVPELNVRQFLLKNIKRNDKKSKTGSGFTWRINLKAISREIENIGEGLVQPQSEGSGGVCFDKPALFIKGGKSQFISVQDAVLIKKLFPNSQITTIENAGHWVHIDEREKFTDAINVFLSE